MYVLEDTGGSSGGTSDYTDLENKPSINNVTLEGNITTQQLGVDKHFKGWYNTLAELKAAHTAVEGDSAYVKDASPATTWSIYVYDATASSDNNWADSGTDADTSNVQTFATGEEVNETYIDDTHLVNPKSGALPIAEDVLQLKAKLDGVTAEEIKVTTIEDWYPEDSSSGYYKNDGNWVNYQNINSTRISVVGYKSVRFLGYAHKTTTVSYAFVKEDGTFCTGFPKPYRDASLPDSNSVLREYKKTVPEDAVYLVCVDMSSLINPSNFYCYLHSGDTIGDMLSFEGAELLPFGADNVVAGNKYITSSNKWFSANSNNSVLIKVEPGDVIAFKKGTTNGAYAVLTSNVVGESNTAVSNFATGFNGRFVVVSSGVLVTPYITIPSDGHYLYKQILSSGNSINSSEYRLSTKLVKKEVNTIKEGVFSGNMGLTHLAPENQGQLNAVRRMRQLTDLEWTPVFDIPRYSSAAGKFYEDVFKAGVKYKGIPYASALNNASNLGYNANSTGFKVGIFISLETFMTAICNKGTVVNEESVYANVTGNRGASFFANVCAGTVSAALHIDYTNTNSFYNIPFGFYSVGEVGEGFDLKDLRLGDVMVAYNYHTVMVTDVIYGSNGEVAYVEVSESATSGNDSYDAKGTQYGGIARRLWWSASRFFVKWDDYKVIRYMFIGSVPYSENAYVPMPNEYYGDAPHAMACLPYMGNNFRYVSGKITTNSARIVVTLQGKEKLHILKDGEDYGELLDIPSFGADDEYVYVQLPTNMAVGEYEAYACKIDNGSEVEKTNRCKWSVVNSITLLDEF